MRKFKRITRRYTVASSAGRKKLSSVHPLKGHPFVVPVFTFLILFFITSIGLVIGSAQTIGASDSRIIELTVDGIPRTVPTRSKNVKELLTKLEIPVNKNDIVSPSLDTKILEDDMKISVQKARPVTIVDQGKVVTLLSPHQQPRTIVEDAGIKLYPEDGIETEVPTSAPNGEVIIGDQIVVDRSVLVSVNLYGNDINVRTRANTVGQLLEQKEIKALEGDVVLPVASTKIKNGLKVFVVRKGKKIITLKEKIKAPTVTVEDSKLAAGLTKVKQKGQDGQRIVTYEVVMKKGKIVKKRELQEVIAVKPVRRVIAKGTKPTIVGTRADWLRAVGISPSEYYAVDYIIGRESGWCPTKWQGEWGGCPAYHGAPTSGGVGYGLCQATPGYKMASAGSDWAVNPVTQLKWCTGYARGRYGSWTAAYQFWSANHWW